MKINVIYNKYIENYEKELLIIENLLRNKNVDFRSFNIADMEYYGDFSIAIGGDGTLLRTARFYSEYKVPVLGINKGRLGFLSQIDVNETEKMIEQIIAGNYNVEKRMMLSSEKYLALNDFVIKGCIPSRTSKFFLEINGNNVCNYIADGLIIATPTGSTAYGLSAGGPIIYPTLDVITIVPICPHTLNARPLVIASSENIVVKTNDKLLSVSIDGYDTTECFEKIAINVSEKFAYLAFVQKEPFYSVLKNKMHWGLSPES